MQQRSFLAPDWCGLTCSNREFGRGSIKPKGMDNSMKNKTNRSLRKSMQINGQSVIVQSGICFGLLHLFRGNSVNLSLEGRDIYLANIARRISDVLLGLDGKRRDSSKADPSPFYGVLSSVQKAIKIGKIHILLLAMSCNQRKELFYRPYCCLLWPIV